MQSETLILAQVKDGHLVRRVCGGDLDAFEQLVRRHEDRVFRLLGAHVPWSMVEELAHDVFVRAWTSLPKLDHPDKFYSWLSTIVMRTNCDFWRHNSKSNVLSMGLWKTDDANEEGSEEAFPLLEMACQIHREQQRKEDLEAIVDALLSTLEEEERKLIQWVYFDGYRQQEAARRMGWSEGTVRVRLHRIREKLRGNQGRVL